MLGNRAFGKVLHCILNVSTKKIENMQEQNCEGVSFPFNAEENTV